MLPGGPFEKVGYNDEGIRQTDGYRDAIKTKPEAEKMITDWGLFGISQGLAELNPLLEG